MQPFTVEFTAHRIGADVPERATHEWQFGPLVFAVHPEALPGVTTWISGAHTTAEQLGVRLEDVAYAMPGWIGGQIRIYDVNYRPIGGPLPRPFLLYALPHDVPTWVNVVEPYEQCVYTVGMRVAKPVDMDISDAVRLAREVEAERHIRAEEASRLARADAAEAAGAGADQTARQTEAYNPVANSRLALDVLTAGGLVVPRDQGRAAG